MKFEDFINLIAFGVACWLAWLIGREVRARNEQLTVEQEEERDRSVIAFIGPHSPGLTVGDYPDSYDDPVYNLVTGLTEKPPLARTAKRI